MRRLSLPLALLVLTGTLVAQTPQPATGPGTKFTFESFVRNGDDRLRWKKVRFEFSNGVTITADEALTPGFGTEPHFNNRTPFPVELTGNVQMTITRP